ncbi:hypothetical protein SKAU_G00101600 [Synaphobranchus kaupii]|uniref:Uncharacterized protein n=1 Tax=Synaphobranchus kaupii TaxID=118154 RepID=A0A9Q1FZA7_SYNKA|nr:hypothetical protein SKAU_G00101600 [Synaphobranchus kaupii]
MIPLLEPNSTSKLKQRWDAVIEELREARSIHDERSKELAGMSVWSSQKTRAERKREILELRIEVCHLIEFCCDLLLNNNSLMARNRSKTLEPLKDEASELKLKAYDEKCIVEDSVSKLYPPIQSCHRARNPEEASGESVTGFQQTWTGLWMDEGICRLFL